jgi:hypothetical protein
MHLRVAVLQQIEDQVAADEAGRPGNEQARATHSITLK